MRPNRALLTLAAVLAVGLLTIGERSIRALTAATPATEWTVSFKTTNNYYMVAENGGGYYVNANRTAIGPWETFTLYDWDGGNIEDGDFVGIRTWNGNTWLWSDPNEEIIYAIGGGPSDTLYQIQNQDQYSQTITNGTHIALYSWDIGRYICAEGGGGSYVSVNRNVAWSWETFELVVH